MLCYIILYCVISHSSKWRQAWSDDVHGPSSVSKSCKAAAAKSADLVWLSTNSSTKQQKQQFNSRSESNKKYTYIYIYKYIFYIRYYMYSILHIVYSYILAQALEPEAMELKAFKLQLSPQPYAKSQPGATCDCPSLPNKGTWL